jgi:hypothetical protein
MTMKRHSYEVRLHADLKQWFLHLDGGTDPRDGGPLEYATALTPQETIYWQCGEKDKLEASLRARGIPLPGRSMVREWALKRLLRKVRKALLG